MKYKYKFHPGQYEIGENEKFYSDMEARGWRLVQRRAYRSKFEPVEPSNARYRIEVCAQGLLEQAAAPGMSEEQLAVFEDCGWEHVCTSLPLYIFRAPAGSDAPEFYMDPAQQAQTLKKMKRDAIWGWVPNVVVWGFWLAIYLSLSGASKLAGEFQIALVQMPPLFLLAGFLLLQELYSGIRNAWIITRTYQRMKKGIPLDHNPRKSRAVHRAVNGTLWGLAVLSGLLLAVQLIGVQSTDLPETTGDPYLLLSDLGWEGERTSFMGKDPGVTYSSTLLADYWDVVEYMECPDGRSPWMYQDVYRLRDPDMAYWLADALLRTATLSRVEHFQPIEAEGLDAAWTSYREELVAVKGDLVIYITYLPDTSRDFNPQDVCATLARQWRAATLPGRSLAESQ